MTESDRCPLIFDIRHFSMEDGPGIRTTVFFKGCPLSCVWCQNLESQKSEAEIAFYADLCIGCGDCKSVCPENAVDLDDVQRIDRDACTACGCCAEACPTMALKLVGKYYSQQALVEILMRDRNFYLTSGGGITFSGGEPTVHIDYLSQVLKALKLRQVHVTLQTAGVFDIGAFRKQVLPWVDLIQFDIKLIDPKKHFLWTGADNASILGNFADLFKEVPDKILPRIPMIPGITATPENIQGIASFLKLQGCTRCDFLPYNPTGKTKWVALGGEVHPDLPKKPLSFTQMELLRRCSGLK
jgi:pyruvate formate lyase activating enzyme